MSREYELRSEFLKKATGLKSVDRNSFEEGFLGMIEKKKDARQMSDVDLETLKMDCLNIDLVSEVKEVLLYQMNVKDISFLKSFTFLEKLDLIKINNLDLTDISTARNMRRVRELFIADCTFEKGRRGLVLDGFIRSVEKNDLSFNNFYSLKSIVLENIHNIEPDFILRHVRNPEILETLKLNNDTLPNKRTMQRFINLKELVVGNNMSRKIRENTDISKFLEAIPHPEKIETLYIREANLNGSDLEVLRKFKNLKNLYIDNIKDGNIVKILENVYGKNKIENLVISQCDLKNADFGILERFHKLRNLFITNNENVNGNSICQALSGNQNFEILNICNNKITDYSSFSNVQAKKLYALGNKLPLRRIGTELRGANFVSDDRIVGFDGKRGRENFLRIHRNEDGKLEKDIHINSKDLQDVAKYIKFSDISTLTLQLENIEDIRPYMAKLTNVPRVNVEIPNTKALKYAQAKYLAENFRMDKIIVADERDSNSSYDRNSYNISDYMILKDRILNITSKIPRRGREAERFLKLYKILQEELSYDRQILSTYESYSKNNVNNSRNMLNGLLMGKCVCAGFADILKNCLSEIGIEAREISGNNHQWNQVKIDGRWYNVDLTVDASCCKGDENSYRRCLLSDDEFSYSKHASVGQIEKCTQSYDQDAIAFFEKNGRLPFKKSRDELFEKIGNTVSTKAIQIREFLKRKKIQKLPKAVTVQESKQEFKRFENIPNIESADSFLEELEEQEKEKKMTSPEWVLNKYKQRTMNYGSIRKDAPQTIRRRADIDKGER